MKLNNPKEMNVQKVCRICFETTNQNEMLSPCDCSGTMAYIHSNCLKNWIQTKNEVICDICKQKWRGVTIFTKNKNFIDYLKADPYPWYCVAIIIFISLLPISDIIFRTKHLINNKESHSYSIIVLVVVILIICAVLLLISPIMIYLVVYDYKEWLKVNHKTISLIEATNDNPFNVI